MQLLLDQGEDINATASDRVSPLHVAACHGCDNVVQVLLDYGADVDSSTSVGSSPHQFLRCSNLKLIVLELGTNSTAYDSRAWIHNGGRPASVLWC